jgi:hypothetical protein
MRFGSVNVETDMPGASAVLEVILFDQDGDGSLRGRLADADFMNEADARDFAERLAERHAGTVALKREMMPAVGEAQAPVVLAAFGRTGDFD